MLNMTGFQGGGQKLTSAKYGFTLAEVLITLSIIGIVSALTLPNVLGNYRTKTYVAQLQRFYNQMSNAADQMMIDENTDNLYDTYLSEDDGPERFLKKYFKVTKSCGAAEDGNDCFAASYKFLDNSDAGSSLANGFYCANINTGAMVCMDRMYYDENYQEYGWHGDSWITVDINGKNGPNIHGRDIFFLELYSDGTVGDRYEPHDADNINDRCTEVQSVYGGTCVEKIISDGWKMDY